MELTAGHIHEAVNTAGVVLTIWPTPWPDRWHVSSSRMQATTEPVATDMVDALLASWDFTAETWRHWPGPLHATNPAVERWAAYDRIERGI